MRQRVWARGALRRGGGRVEGGNDRYVARPTSSVSGPCRWLPRTGLGTTQTTTDPVRDRRSEFPKPFRPGALIERACPGGFIPMVGRQGRGSPRHEPAHLNLLSTGQAQYANLTSNQRRNPNGEVGGAGWRVPTARMTRSGSSVWRRRSCPLTTAFLLFSFPLWAAP